MRINPPQLWGRHIVANNSIAIERIILYCFVQRSFVVCCEGILNSHSAYYGVLGDALIHSNTGIPLATLCKSFVVERLRTGAPFPLKEEK